MGITVMTIRFVLMLAAIIVFLLVAAGVSAPRINLLALGLALWALAMIVTV
jgi:hypothetical protein